jgi:hypothetical protein
MITLQAARRYEELLGENVAQSPYDYAALFEAKGWFARRRAKARFKLLQKLDAKLTRVLRPNERVYFVSTGSLNSGAEQFFAGWAAYYINLRALIFTTERVILMQIGGNSKPRELVTELPYTSIRQVKATWSGFCEVILANGKKHRFSGMPKADRKFLRDFLAGVVSGESTASLAKKSDGLVHLCPHCFTGVPAWPLVCGDCGGGIKSARTAALLSLLFPGLGDWYLGHRGLAAMEMMGTAFLWFVLVIAPLAGIETDEEPVPADSVYWAVAAVLIGGTHLIDSALTHCFARKGHHPGKPPLASAPAR